MYFQIIKQIITLTEGQGHEVGHHVGMKALPQRKDLDPDLNQGIHFYSKL